MYIPVYTLYRVRAHIISMYTISESPIKTRWPGEVLGKHTHAREMSWSIITRERRSFVYFFSLRHTLLLSGGHRPVSRSSIYYYVLIRCCNGLWESDPIYTVFFSFLFIFFFYICFTLLLLLLFCFFIIILNPITLSKSIGTAFEMRAKKTQNRTDGILYVGIYIYTPINTIGII